MTLCRLLYSCHLTRTYIPETWILKRCYSNSHVKEFCRILVKIDIYYQDQLLHNTKSLHIPQPPRSKQQCQHLGRGQFQVYQHLCFTFYFLVQSTTKSYNTPTASICISARRHMDNIVFDKFLNNQTGKRWSVLSFRCLPWRRCEETSKHVGSFVKFVVQWCRIVCEFVLVIYVKTYVEGVGKFKIYSQLFVIISFIQC
jgi:hypothetical protein